MRLIRRVLQQSRHRSAERLYEQRLATPYHRFATVILSRAAEQGADAVCFGFRPDIVEDDESREARRKASDDFSAWLAAQRLIHPSYIVADQSAKTRGPKSHRGLPISFRVGGIIQYFGDQPFHSYGSVLKAIQSRTVALGASEDNPQPMRYIEIGYGMSKHPVTSGPSGMRRFLEVDLEFQEDNTFWIYIRAIREIALNVRVSDSIF
jgi:hypothetical protein